MSVVEVDPNARQLAAEDVNAVVEAGGLAISESLLKDYTFLASGLEAAIASLPDDKPVLPVPDLAKYPRTDIYIPEDNDLGAWATKVTAKSVAPTSSLLKGRTIALKDNMAFAGVRCTNGTSMVDWTPEIDATVATRLMDAGGLIVGKSACENSCLEGLSATSVTGMVHNPYAEGYSAGGSSSGSGRLVGKGTVDMAIGCDQGGSIRMPAASCGIVGLKPTWGLVPYTGILSLDATIDHAGPMTQTVRDCALMLEAIAGPDGWDDRQPPFGLEGDRLKFVAPVDEILAKDNDKMLEGFTVGILTEGFEVDGQDQNTVDKVKAAAAQLGALGAKVEEVSIALHKQAPLVWMCSLAIPGGRQALLGDLDGRKQLAFTDRAKLVGPKLTQQQFDALGPGATKMYLDYLWVQKNHGADLLGKCMNLRKSISDAYDKALAKYDVLIMPTMPYPAPKLPENGYEEGLLKFVSRTTSMISNTAPFNNSGHPALSLPVGFVPAREDKEVKLPIGMQIVGRQYGDVDCLKVAAAWEKAFDWKSA